MVSKLISPLVITGPSGVGKSTFIKRLLSHPSKKFELNVSHTTRNPRVGERDGFDYFFITREEFERRIKNDEFIEYAEVHKNLYGTAFSEVIRIAKKGNIPVLDIDVQGALSMKKKEAEFHPNFLFIIPPSIKILEERLRARGTESEESLRIRIAAAEKEINMAKNSGIYKEEDYIVNDDLEVAYSKFYRKVLGLYTDVISE